MSEPRADGGLAARFATALEAADGTPHLGAKPSAVVSEVAGSPPATIAVDDDAALDGLVAELHAAGYVVVRPHEPSYREALPDAAQRVTPSAITFVTGPSRSADIEQILTLGVHGPARVHVVL